MQDDDRIEFHGERTQDLTGSDRCNDDDKGPSHQSVGDCERLVWDVDAREATCTRETPTEYDQRKNMGNNKNPFLSTIPRMRRTARTVE